MKILIQTIDDKFLDLETFWQLSKGGGIVQWDSELRARGEESRQVLRSLLDQNFHLYGITTGFGQQADLRFSFGQESLLQAALVDFHGAGVGPVLSYEASRAIFLARIMSVSRGFSGIRPALVDFMMRLFNAGVAPVIPELGSVGASGDLTPLSYLAALLSGQREGWYQGRRLPAAEVLGELKEEPWTWQGKEALAILNGTGVMTGIASLAWAEVSHLADWVDAITALGASALGLPEEPYLPFLHQVKGHPGNQASARRILELAKLSTIPIGHPSAYETQ
ncbi:MAG: aromatic amino acid lyase, partial [Spirochaetales bacterium]|nr:aromatic amino acid lyase [Spirochaetales bacterium]